MALTEVIDGLDSAVNKALQGHLSLDEHYALEVAISHLHPYTQPITPERLEAAGFRQYREMWQRDIRDSVIIRLYWTAAAGMQVETNDGDQSVLPGVRSMGHVLSLVEMLEGGDH